MIKWVNLKASYYYHEVANMSGMNNLLVSKRIVTDKKTCKSMIENTEIYF